MIGVKFFSWKSVLVKVLMVVLIGKEFVVVFESVCM